MLAHGSNRAPEQLGRKFPKGQIPVTRGWLKDHIVVYAACLTRYGACPSLLWSFPGAEVQVSINWLTPEQLGIMHRTEGNYAFGRLKPTSARRKAPSRDTPCLSRSPWGAAAGRKRHCPLRGDRSRVRPTACPRSTRSAFQAAGTCGNWRDAIGLRAADDRIPAAACSFRSQAEELRSTR